MNEETKRLRQVYKDAEAVCKKAEKAYDRLLQDLTEDDRNIMSGDEAKIVEHFAQALGSMAVAAEAVWKESDGRNRRRSRRGSIRFRFKAEDCKVAAEKIRHGELPAKIF